MTATIVVQNDSLGIGMFCLNFQIRVPNLLDLRRVNALLSWRSPTLLGVGPAVNAAALGMLLVMLPGVEDLASLLSSEVLLTLHGLRLRALAVSLVVPAALVPTTFVPTTFVLPLGTLMFGPIALVPTVFVLSAHGFRHFTFRGENHALVWRRIPPCKLPQLLEVASPRWLMFLGFKGTTLLGIWPAVNAAALGVLLVVSPPVENLACLLGGEVLLTLHSLRLRALTVAASALLVLTLRSLVGPLGCTLVPAALVMSLHGFRHYIRSGENHA